MSWHSMLSQNRVEGFDQDQSDSAKEPRWLIPPPQFVVEREIPRGGFSVNVKCEHCIGRGCQGLMEA